MKITLPSGLEVELAAWSWDDARTFFKRCGEFLEQDGKTHADWMEHVLTEHYPDKLLAEVRRSSPDIITLYNETVRFNQSGPDAVKNSSCSGTGPQTQSGSSTAPRAQDQ